MKLFYFHIFLIRSFALYVLTCLFIVQTALSVCPGCGNNGETFPDLPDSPDSSLCPSCKSSASGAEAVAAPENIRTVLRRAIENLPSDHAFFQDERHQGVIDILRESDDITVPTDVNDFLDEMERRVDTLNSQITANGSNRLQLVQPRNSFTFPLNVSNAHNNGVPDARNFYDSASRLFLTLEIFFPVHETDTEEQQRVRQQSVKPLYEALLLYSLLLTSSDKDTKSYLLKPLEEYINSYRSLHPHLPSDTSLFEAVCLTEFEIAGYLGNPGTPLDSSLIPSSVQLHHIGSRHPAVALVRTLNNVSYIFLYGNSLPPVTLTTSPDQLDSLLQNVRETLNAIPGVSQQWNIQNSFSLLELASRLMRGNLTTCVFAAIGVFLAFSGSKSNTGK